MGEEEEGRERRGKGDNHFIILSNIISLSLSRPITLTVAKCLEPEAYAPMFEPRRKLAHKHTHTLHLQYSTCTYWHNNY